MGNPISKQIKIGTVGELLVQLRLLQYGVQAAPPLKDSGNDLIAVKGEAFRGIQIKTTTKKKFRWNNLPEHYHILALVRLAGEEENILLDKSQIFLVHREKVDTLSVNEGGLDEFAISQQLVDELFKE